MIRQFQENNSSKPNPDEPESKSPSSNQKFLPKKQKMHGLGPDRFKSTNLNLGAA
jgi:hypothetical protein